MDGTQNVPTQAKNPPRKTLSQVHADAKEPDGDAPQVKHDDNGSLYDTGSKSDGPTLTAAQQVMKMRIENKLDKVVPDNNGDVLVSVPGEKKDSGMEYYPIGKTGFSIACDGGTHSAAEMTGIAGKINTSLAPAVKPPVPH